MLNLEPFYLNISGYRFTPVEDPESTLKEIKEYCSGLDIKGSVLMAREGINIAMAGNILAITQFTNRLNQDSRFADIPFHLTYSKMLPFDKSVFKIKQELVPIENDQLHPDDYTHQYLPGDELDQWLDSGKDFTLLDMRNDFEYEIGTFATAQHLNLPGFRKLKYKHDELAKIPKDKPIVTFCTGGIRCEKAGPYLETQGFKEVYQLKGGIIDYLRKTSGKHWVGNCFVFDERVSVDKNLRPQHIDLCFVCQRKLTPQETQYCEKCIATNETADVAV